MASPENPVVRRHGHCANRAGIVLLATVAVMLATGADAKRKSSGGAGIAGNTIHGFESDGEYYDYYAPNGSASSMLNGGDVTHGSWSMQGGSLCVSYPSDTPTCYAIELNGSQITLTDPNGTVLSGQILRGNPKGI